MVDLSSILLWVVLYGLVCALAGAGFLWIIWPRLHRRGCHRKGSTPPPKVPPDHGGRSPSDPFTPAWSGGHHPSWESRPPWEAPYIPRQ